MKPIKVFSLVLLTSSLFSCNFGDKSRMDTVTGKANEVVIVIGTEIWNGEVGSVLRRSLAQPQSALPQEEPLFSLINVPPEAFINLFKSSRNIITVNISSANTEPKVEFAPNSWAYPQSVVKIEASSKEIFKQIFAENESKILSYFLSTERERLQSTYLKAYDKAVYNTLLDIFKFKLYVPAGFNVVKKDSSFAWVRYDTPLITQNLIIYSYPYDSDSTFTLSFQLEKRNLILKNNIPGPLPGSYMTTEMDLPQDFSILDYNGNYASEMRGLWKLENDFMGGPFVSLSVLDASRRRIITIEGNVYAPKNDKRNYIRQMEAMIYSLEFPSQKINDKINQQLNMGN